VRYGCNAGGLAVYIIISILIFSLPHVAIAESTCTTCHDMPPVDSFIRNPVDGGTVGNHQSHQPADASASHCAICHPGADAFTTDHRDGRIALSPSLNGSPTGQYLVNGTATSFKNQTTLPRLGSCGSVNCHFEKVTPVWGAAQFRYSSATSNDCNRCHAAAPNDGNHPFGQQKHGLYYGTTTSSCGKCHPDHTSESLPFAHATSAGNRPLIVTFATAPNNGFGRYTGNVTYPGYLPSRNAGRNGSCTNVYCHSPGTRAAGSVESPNRSAAWGGTLDCIGCHKGTQWNNYMATGSHYGHVFGGGTSYSQIKCASCHAATVTASMTIADRARHVDGQVDVAFSSSSSAANGSYNGNPAKPFSPATKSAGSGYGSCQNVYCHSTGQAQDGTWPPVYTTPVWGVPGTGKCGTCHGTTGSSTHGGFLNAVIERTIASGSHTKHLKYTYSISDREMRCAVCHAYEPASFSIKGSTCGPVCHTGTSAKHANYEINVGIGSYFGTAATYNGPSTPGSGYGACSAVYCHSDGQATPSTYAVPTWGNAASGACGTCHGASSATPPASAPHRKHMGSTGPYRFACAECHSGSVQATASAAVIPTFTNATTHVNKSREVRFDSTNPFGIYSSVTGSCLNLYCHSSGNTAVASSSLPGIYGGSVYARLSWNGKTSCNSCHGRSTANGMPDYATAGSPGSATANSHGKHVASSAIGCGECHEKTTKSGSIRSAYHVNGTPSVFFNLSGGNKGGVYTTANKTCASTYCHGTASAVAWGGTTSCVSCHGATFTTFSSLRKKGAHSLHIETNSLPVSFTASGAGNLSASGASYQFGCGSCHSPARAGHANGVANSGSGAAEVYFGYTSAVMKGAYVPGSLQAGTDNGFTWTAGTGCNTSYCHSNGQNAPGRVNVAWSAPRGSLGCNGCHGNAMSNSLSGKHVQHVNPNVQASLGAGNGFGCVQCHAKTLSNGTTIGDRRYHVNKFVDYSSPRGGGSSRYNRGTKQCSNIYCHSNGNPGALVYSDPPAWNSTATLGCNGCHGKGSQIGAPDYQNEGSGNPRSNSHFGHIRNASGTTICVECHAKTASATISGSFKDYSAAKYHINGTPDVNFGARAGTSASYNKSTGECSNVACHGNVAVSWGSTGGGCLTCHASPIGGRAAIGPQFSANSHHVQGTEATSAHCFQCHWEANADGTINYAYHDSATSGGPVDLVIYGAGSRPATYTEGTTAIRYTANGTRNEFAKINTHCLGCHSDRNNAATPFGDGKTPRQYAWDNNSISARYGDTSTTPWSKKSGNNVTPKNTVTKALSAHGNATANHGGFNTSETWPDTRNGAAIVLCFDCHNSHGSSVSGTTTSYASATANGGILKDTTAGKGGYTQSYRPAAGGSTVSRNLYNAGAGLCFDCHLTASAGTKPWGYSGTFGATQAILGFMDTPYFGTGTFPRQTTFSYKATPNMGGHFGASSALSISASRSINGLCTPCHDPHGVSPTLGANKVYAVPLLKGTWMTSPYKEDAAPATDENFVAIAAVGYNGEYEGPTRSSTKLATQQTYMKAYRIDQNTFGPGGNAAMNSTAYPIGETDAQFAGLCLNCHGKSTLTNGTNHAWTSKDRIHESVNGWKTVNGTIQHTFTCSKCHAPHNAGLPRLMVSNCLDSQHKGRVAYNTAPKLLGSYRGDEGYGSGRWPGSYSALVGEDGQLNVNKTFTCHENNDATQKWNVKTRWNTGSGWSDPGGAPVPVPVLIAEPDASCSYNCSIQLRWNSFTSPGWGTTQYQVQVSSSNTFGTLRASSSWQTGTYWTVDLPRGTWYWRVMARNAANTSQISGWSAYDRFMLY